jgi:hypothetical protein
LDQFITGVAVSTVRVRIDADELDPVIDGDLG